MPTDIADFATRKYGPLPVWAWGGGLLVMVGGFWYLRRRGGVGGSGGSDSIAYVQPDDLIGPFLDRGAGSGSVPVDGGASGVPDTPTGVGTPAGTAPADAPPSWLDDILAALAAGFAGLRQPPHTTPTPHQTPTTPTPPTNALGPNYTTVPYGPDNPSWAIPPTTVAQPPVQTGVVPNAVPGDLWTRLKAATAPIALKPGESAAHVTNRSSTSITVRPMSVKLSDEERRALFGLNPGYAQDRALLGT